MRFALSLLFSYRGIIFLIALLLAIPVARAEGWLGGTRRVCWAESGTGTKITRLGWGTIAIGVLTLMLAGSTGNNLLYLLYSACAASLVLSAVAGWLNLRGLSCEAEAPAQVFRGAPFSLRLKLKRTGPWAAFGVEAVLDSSRGAPGVLRSGDCAEVELKARAGRRGWNELSRLILESRFPWGLIVHRRELPPAKVLALPRLREVHGAAEVRAQARASGRPSMRKGAGDELFGIRVYDPSDDVRKINWKLSARAGRPLVNEYCEAHDSKITVTVPVSQGEDAERRVEEAASACRYYIDSGAEVRLVTPESEVDYGKGLLHLDRLLTNLALLGEGRAPRAAPTDPAASLPPVADTPVLRRLTVLGAYLVYASIFLIDDVNPRFWALALPLLPLGWRAQEKRWSPIPDGLWHLCSVAVLGYAVLVDWRNVDFTTASTHVLMYLLVNRLLNPFRTEELRQTFLVFSLAFLLVSGLTISPWYFAFFLGYLAFCGGWMWLAAGASWEERSRWAPALAGWAAAGAALSALCFAATPRLEGWRRITPLLGSFVKLEAKSSVATGFTENVTLGWFGELKRSSARVMKVKPLSPREGAPGPLRIRGSAYAAFDGTRWKKEPMEFSYPRDRRWGTSTAGRGWAAHRGRELKLPAPIAGSGPAFEFDLYPLNLSVLFTVGTPWYVSGVDDSAYFDYTDSVYFATPYLGGLRYSAYSSVDPDGLHVGLAKVDDKLRDRYLAMPPDPGGRIAELARVAIGDARGDAAKARAIEHFLRGRYTYSTFSDSRGRPLSAFLFESRKGNCEYFASAGVVLMRAVGIPARLVTGFVSQDWNDFGQFYDVRQRSAHSWVEAYLPRIGWTTLDPTPGQSIFSLSADALSRRVERLIDAFQGEWYRSVIGYDGSTQANTFRRIGVALSLSAMFEASRRGLILLAAGWALWGIWTGLGEARRRWERSRVLGPYGRAEGMLARAGLPRPAGMTPREFAAEIARRRPELSGLSILAEMHYRERYARRPPSAAQSAEGSRLLRELGSRL